MWIDYFGFDFGAAATFAAAVVAVDFASASAAYIAFVELASLFFGIGLFAAALAIADVAAAGIAEPAIAAVAAANAFDVDAVNFEIACY